MYEIFLGTLADSATDALTDSAAMIPLLLIIYIGIELIEYRYGNKIREGIQKAGAAGPAIGAVSGSFPQCGVSVVTTCLYTQRLVTIGTLLAVYLSTSDEAIPIILSQPDKASILVPLIATKIIIAVIAGYSIDAVFRRSKEKTLAHIGAVATGTDDKSHHHETIVEKTGCCGHDLNSSAKKFDPRQIILHPVIHTAKVFIFILGVSILINLAFSGMGDDAIASLFATHIFFQPFLAALIGLIPNCAASVAITELYLKRAITYGAVIAGLCASGGLGLLVLFREEKERKNVYLIVALLFSISVVAGLVIQYL